MVGSCHKGERCRVKVRTIARQTVKDGTREAHLLPNLHRDNSLGSASTVPMIE